MLNSRFNVGKNKQIKFLSFFIGLYSVYIVFNIFEMNNYNKSKNIIITFLENRK